MVQIIIELTEKVNKDMRILAAQMDCSKAKAIEHTLENI